MDSIHDVRPSLASITIDDQDQDTSPSSKAITNDNSDKGYMSQAEWNKKASERKNSLDDIDLGGLGMGNGAADSRRDDTDDEDDGDNFD